MPQKSSWRYPLSARRSSAGRSSLRVLEIVDDDDRRLRRLCGDDRNAVQPIDTVDDHDMRMTGERGRR